MAVNPNGEQLSSDEIPMIYIYDTLLLIWVGIVMAWLGNFFLFRRVRFNLYQASVY